MEADIIFDDNLIMLACISIPYLYTTITYLKDKTADSIIKALDKVIAMFMAFGQKVKIIRVDCEQGVVQAKTKDELIKVHGITVDMAGKGNHAIPSLDRKIRTIKNHVRVMRLMTKFAVGGFLLLGCYLQMANIVNILPTSGNTGELSPMYALFGRGVNLDKVCPHRPLETVLVAKHNDYTNTTYRENMGKAIFLFASNIHIKKDAPEFTYMMVDTLETVTRKKGIKCQINDELVKRINQMANTPTSRLFCPSFAKFTERKTKGRPKGPSGKVTADQMVSSKEIRRQETEQTISATPKPHEIPNPEHNEEPTLRQLLQSAQTLGKIHARNSSPIVERGVFTEDLAASFMNKKATQVNKLNEMRIQNGVQYQFFHKVQGKSI